MRLPLQALALSLLICLSNTLLAFDCEGIATAPGEEITAERVVTGRSEEHTSELQSLVNLVCRLLLEKKKKKKKTTTFLQITSSPSV